MRLASHGVFPFSVHDVSPLRRVIFDLSIVRHGSHPDESARGSCPNGGGDACRESYGRTGLAILGDGGYAWNRIFRNVHRGVDGARLPDGLLCTGDRGFKDFY